MRFLIALMLLLLGACQEDAGMIVVRDDAGHFIPFDASEAGIDGDTADGSP